MLSIKGLQGRHICWIPIPAADKRMVYLPTFTQQNDP